jgi:CubicO group peptidase (beta-lactamase class C family)
MDIAQITDTATAIGGRLIRGDLKGLSRLMKINTLFDADKIVWNFTNMDKLAETRVMPCASPAPIAIPNAPRDLIDSYSFQGKTTTLADYKMDRNVTAFLVIKDGKIAQEEYLQGTTQNDLRISWSMAKSVVSLLLGALIDKGLIDITALDDKIVDHVPSLRGSGYDGPTLRNILQMSSGVAFNEDYLNYHSDINRMGRVLAIGGSMDAFAASLGKRWDAGTYMHYVSVDTHVIGMVIRAITGLDISTLTIDHIFKPLGFEHDPYFLTDSFDEPFILGGLNMTTRDYARIGLMVLNGGMVDDTRVVSQDWLDLSMAPSAPPPSPEKAATPEGWMKYGMQWWIPGDAIGGEVYGIGIYGQYLYLNPKHNVVIAQNGGDINFKDGNGIIEQECLALFRQIAERL